MRSDVLLSVKQGGGGLETGVKLTIGEGDAQVQTGNHAVGFCAGAGKKACHLGAARFTTGRVEEKKRKEQKSLANVSVQKNLQAQAWECKKDWEGRNACSHASYENKKKRQALALEHCSSNGSHVGREEQKRKKKTVLVHKRSRLDNQKKSLASVEVEARGYEKKRRGTRHR